MDCVDTRSTEDGFLPWMWQWKFPFRCQNLGFLLPYTKMFGHTLRSSSQTLGMNRNPKRERERERENERAPSVLPMFYFSRVFIVFKGGGRLNSAELALIVWLRNSDSVIITSVGRLGVVSDDASWYNLSSFQSCWRSGTRCTSLKM